MGSWVARTSAKSALTTSRSMSTPPAAPRGFLRQNRATAVQTPIRSVTRPATVTISSPVLAMTGLVAITDPGIEPTVEKIHHEVRQDHHDGGEHDQILHDRVVTPQDRLHQEPRHTRQIEDGLSHHEPADEKRELEADDSDHGKDGVLQGVAPDHQALA